MNLRSPLPYWLATTTTHTPPQRRTRRLDVDVLIIGAGVTGGFAAAHLAAAGLDVAVIDHRPPASGSTPASTGLLMYEIDVPLVELIERLGREDAEQAYRACYRVLGEFKRELRSARSEIDLITRPSLQLAVTPGDAAKLRAEQQARRRLGIDVEYLRRRELRERFGVERPGALLSRHAMEVNPLALTRVLLRRATRNGATLLRSDRLDLDSLAGDSRPFQVRIGPGRVTARNIVIATGYETPHQFREVAALTSLLSTFAVCTTSMEAPAWPRRALIWETGERYFYGRTTVDGRIMIGGEDEPFRSPARREAMVDRKSRTLMKKLFTLFPNLKAADLKPEYRWAGTFAQTEDGLPYIGQHPRYPDVYFALGYGGNGITFSLLAAQIITSAITRRPRSGHRAAAVFGFGRGG